MPCYAFFVIKSHSVADLPLFCYVFGVGVVLVCVPFLYRERAMDVLPAFSVLKLQKLLLLQMVVIRFFGSCSCFSVENYKSYKSEKFLLRAPARARVRAHVCAY